MHPRLGIALCCVVPVASVFSSAIAGEKPVNVLFIMSDQHNARVLGCAGNPQVQTPVLDELAAEGARFSHAFCQTGQCCPSRYTIWTGRYAHSHGLRWNGVVEPLAETTVGEILKGAGYATATIGKHHMRHSPTEHGFDLVVEKADFDEFLRAEGQPNMLASVDKMKQPSKAYTGISRAPNKYHPAGYWASETVKFLRANQGRPFCVWLSFYGPHTPIIPSARWAEMYDPEAIVLPENNRVPLTSKARMVQGANEQYGMLTVSQHREMLARYYGFVSQIDFNIGRVLDTLDELGLAENTVVVYTADHGEMASEHGLWTKFTLNYEGTTRIPMILRMPGVIPGGTVVDELVGTVDLLPTLCELTGQPVPQNVQGESLVPLCQGTASPWRDVIFSEIGYPGRAAGRCVLARTKTHAYIEYENYGQPMAELFDMTADPWQKRDVLGEPEYAEVAARLKKAIAQWDATTDHAPMYPVGPKTGGKSRPASPRQRSQPVRSRPLKNGR